MDLTLAWCRHRIWHIGFAFTTEDLGIKLLQWSRHVPSCQMQLHRCSRSMSSPFSQTNMDKLGSFSMYAGLGMFRDVQGCLVQKGLDFQTLKLARKLTDGSRNHFDWHHFWQACKQQQDWYTCQIFDLFEVLWGLGKTFAAARCQLEALLTWNALGQLSRGEFYSDPSFVSWASGPGSVRFSCKQREDTKHYKLSKPAAWCLRFGTCGNILKRRAEDQRFGLRSLPISKRPAMAACGRNSWRLDGVVGSQFPVSFHWMFEGGNS